MVEFELVTWYFEPSQPLGIISGLMEPFIKRHTVERTNKAEIRPVEQSEKVESCRESLWNKIQLKGHKDRQKNRRKKEWASSVGLCQRHEPQRPHNVKVSPGRL